MPRPWGVRVQSSWLGCLKEFWASPHSAQSVLPLCLSHISVCFLSIPLPSLFLRRSLSLSISISLRFSNTLSLLLSRSCSFLHPPSSELAGAVSVCASVCVWGPFARVPSLSLSVLFLSVAGAPGSIVFGMQSSFWGLSGGVIVLMLGAYTPH